MNHIGMFIVCVMLGVLVVAIAVVALTMGSNVHTREGAVAIALLLLFVGACCVYKSRQ